MKDEDATTAVMEAQLAAQGVASVRVRDGQIFLFSRDFCQKMLEKMDKAGTDRAVVFVKSGPDVKDVLQ